MNLKFLSKSSNKEDKKVKTKATINNSVIESEFVKISTKISSVNKTEQIIKLGDRYFKVRELG